MKKFHWFVIGAIVLIAYILYKRGKQVIAPSLQSDFVSPEGNFVEP